MNKTTMTFSLAIALAAVFAIASPLDVAVAQTGEAIPDDGGNGVGDGERDYKDGEHKKDGKSCPFKEKKSQQQSSEQSS